MKETRRKSDHREVYFVRAKTLGHIKIGVANNAWLRFLALDSSSPDELELLGVILTTEGLALEARIQAKFYRERIRREWFAASPKLLAYIARHAKDRDDAIRDDLMSRWPPNAPAKIAA